MSGAAVDGGSLIERALVLARVPRHAARLLASTPSMRWSWAVAVIVAAGSPIAVAASGPRSVLAFVIVAPLVPIGAVAVAYGPWADPLEELTRSSPTSSVRLLLLRTTAVLAAPAAGVAIAVAVLPGADLPAFAWILPSLGLTLATLALSTLTRTSVAATAVAAAWLFTVVALEVRGDVRGAAFSGPAQLAFFGVAVGSGAVLAWRRERVERAGRADRRRLVDVAELERRRIERNLHDGVQQQLVAISVKLGLASGLVERDPGRAVALLDVLKRETQEALDAIRDVTRGSCPPLLADDGLEAALLARAASAPVDVEVRATDLGRFPLPIEVAVYYSARRRFRTPSSMPAPASSRSRSAARRATSSSRSPTMGRGSTSPSPGAVWDFAASRNASRSSGGSIEIRSALGGGTVVSGRVPATMTTHRHQVTVSSSIAVT